MKMNKCLLSTFCIWQICAIALSVEVRRDDKWPPKQMIEWMTPGAKMCKEKTGVTMEAIKEFDSGDIHEDANLKCYMLCIFEAMDIWGEDDRLHLMKMADHLEENYDEEIQDIAIRMGRKCVRVEGDNKCDRAFWYHKCWKMQDPRHYFLM